MKKPTAPMPSGIELRRAKICLSCETIHDEAICPYCGKGPDVWLSQWVQPMVFREKTGIWEEMGTTNA